MRILNQSGEEISAYDPELGYTIEDQVLVQHHDAVEAVEEQGHYEVVTEYPNGGKDVAWVVDVRAAPAVAAYDEYEKILLYVPFTETELAEREIQQLKNKLTETDYVILKIVEGAITTADAAEVIQQRAGWRERINDLENTVEGGSGNG